MKKLSEFAKFNEGGADYLRDHIDVDMLINLLKSAFAEEMNAWYQYFIVAPFLIGKERTNIEKDYQENAAEELAHAKWLLDRINMLGGNIKDIQTPNHWNEIATHKFIEPTTADVQTSLQQQIEAEKGAIETYEVLVAFTRDKDVVTHTKAKEILADEQKHLQELEDFLNDVSFQNINN